MKTVLARCCVLPACSIRWSCRHGSPATPVAGDWLGGRTSACASHSPVVSSVARKVSSLTLGPEHLGDPAQWWRLACPGPEESPAEPRWL